MAGLLLIRRPEGVMSVRPIQQDMVLAAMQRVLQQFAEAAGYEGVYADDLDYFCTASVTCCGETHTLWMAFVPGYDECVLSDELQQEYGVELLALGRSVTDITQERFF